MVVSKLKLSTVMTWMIQGQPHDLGKPHFRKATGFVLLRIMLYGSALCYSCETSNDNGPISLNFRAPQWSKGMVYDWVCHICIMINMLSHQSKKKNTLLGQGRGMIFVYKARPEMGNPAVSRANHLYLTYHLCPRNYQSYTVPISICLCGHVGL